MQAVANINGTISPANEAKISIFDRGFLYGDSIYEVVRTYEGVPFLYEEHFDRLENSARLAQMNLTQTRDFLKEEIRRTVAASKPATGEDVFIRYTITRGESVLDLDPTIALKTSYIILVKPIPAWNKKFYSEGMVLAIPKIRRNSPLALDPNIKSGNYLNNVLAVGEAKKVGADDALLVSIEGKLSEASNSNIGFVFNGKVVFPLHEQNSSSGNLKGITKLVVAKVCAQLGIDYFEQSITPEDIKNASECFVTSATREIMPIRSIHLENGTELAFPTGGGSITQQLISKYKQFVMEYTKSHKNEAIL